VIRKRLTAAALAAGAGLVTLGGVGAGTASAQTATCVNDPAGFCGAQVNAFDNALTVANTTARVNAVVNAAPLNKFAASQDFIAKTYPGGGANGRTFEYAPSNKPSGLFLSFPQTGNRTGLVLRKFVAGSKYQEFQGVNTTDTNGTPWVNVASGRSMQANGTGKQVVQARPVTNPGGASWGFQQAAS
jgi:hypothetical protein